ncbi:hypothetical protein K8R04_00805 [Candidatus Uhrbacteria bacterium]|nr:hypothetical protein [Candidatus Uhrbacteria bacterium]
MNTKPLKSLLALLGISMLLGAGCSSVPTGRTGEERGSGTVYALKNPCILLTEIDISKLVGVPVPSDLTKHEGDGEIALTPEQVEDLLGRTPPGEAKSNPDKDQRELCQWGFKLHPSERVSPYGTAQLILVTGADVEKKFQVAIDIAKARSPSGGQPIDRLPGTAMWFSHPESRSIPTEHRREIHLQDGNLYLYLLADYSVKDLPLPAQDDLIKTVNDILAQLRTS